MAGGRASSSSRSRWISSGRARTASRTPSATCRSPRASSASIVNGNQVRLVPVPVKVLDDGSAVPVITSDASARLASLQSWLAASGYAALAAWAGFAALVAARGRGRRTITAMPPQAAAAAPYLHRARPAGGRRLPGLQRLVVGTVGRCDRPGRRADHRGHPAGDRNQGRAMPSGSAGRTGRGSITTGRSRSARPSGTRSPRTAN